METHARAIIKVLPFGIVVGIILYVILFYSIVKAGFGFHDKTFWNWLELLVVPMALAIAVFIFNKFEKDRERANILDQRMEDALQSYFDKVTDVLRTSPNLKEKDITVIRILTLTTLRRLDGERKGFIVKFLFELGLITHMDVKFPKSQIYNEKAPILSLLGADLNDVYLKGANFFIKEYSSGSDHKFITIDLSGAELKRANFQGAILTGGKLFGSNFSYANLQEASVNSASLCSANLSHANLKNGNFSDGMLQGAKLIDANCRSTNFWCSEFLETLYPNGGDPFVNKAILKGANLRNADFNHAIILPDQLSEARFFWKTRLPGFNLYSRLHPLFVINCGGENLDRGMGRFGNLIGGKCLCGEDLTIDSHNIPEQGFNDIEMLKTLWEKYYIHERKIFSRNVFTKIIYILTEFERHYIVQYENIFAKMIEYFAYINDKKYWKE